MGWADEPPTPSGSVQGSEGGRDLLDVVFVVVEVDGKAQVAVASRAHNAALPQLRQQIDGVSITERHGHDGAASSPMAASQLIELSNREEVDERSMVGPKKLSNGARPAFIRNL